MATQSKLILEFITLPTTGRDITVNVNDGTKDIPLVLTALNQRVASGQFEVDGSPTFDIQETVFNFIFAWNTDHKNTGGINNLQAFPTSQNGNPAVEIILKNGSWQFGAIEGSLITSDEIQPSVTNEPVIVLSGFTWNLLNADCDIATYELNIVGGTGPFTINGSIIDLSTGPIVTSDRNQQIQLSRGEARTITIENADGSILGTDQIVPPKVLAAKHFIITVTQDNGAKASVEPNVVLDSKMLPIEYSLDGINYQSSGEFPNLSFSSQYTLRIRDKFGCERTKTFVTPAEIEGGDQVTREYTRYFEKSNAGSLSGALLEGEPTNFTNMLSFEEKVKLPSEAKIYQYKDAFVVDQFKSGYEYHKITLIENGQARFIEPVLQAQNLFLQEKVDCFLFRDQNGFLGVYFRPGNSYVPNTSTIDDVSSYSATNLPTWAKAGNIVSIDNIGNQTINRVTSDENRGLYLQLNTSYSSLTDDAALIQANYNKQPYNTFEYAIPMSSITNCARVIIELGFVIDGTPLVEKAWGSEIIQKVFDKRGFLQLQWNDTENKAGIVHQTGIVHQMLLPYTKWVGLSESTSELYQSDNETVSLEQNVQDIAQLICTVTGRQMQRKLHQAAGMENFAIDGINYKKREMSSSVKGSTNRYKIEATFELGGNQLTVDAQEIVLDPPETPITSAAPPIPNGIVPSALASQDGGLILNGDGGFLLVSAGN